MTHENCNSGDQAAEKPASIGPLLDPWTGPHGGYPRFDLVKVEDLKPALLKAMDLKRAEIAAIIANPEQATYENTIAAMEDAGRHYSRALSFYGVYASTMSDATMQSIEEDMSPKLQAFSDEILLNDGLFKRIKAVYAGLESSGLTIEQKRVTDEYYRSFTRNGANLDDTQKARLSAINEELAKKFTAFSQHLLADESKMALVVDSAADLAGLSAAQLAAAAAQAEAAGAKGKWAIANTRSSVEPFLTFCTRRDLREKVWTAFTKRGDNGDASDNKAIITAQLKLRAERARLLGYKSHADWVIADNMAKTPEAAMELMMKVWKAAAARIHEEVADMQKVADAEGANIKIEPWDYSFYAEKVRKEKYDLDQNEVKKYFQLDQMIAAMFWAAQQVHGIEMKEIDDVPVVHPDVMVYEVWRGGKQIGLFYLDPYAREGKRSGAWMSAYRTQEKFRGEVTPIVSNNSNFVKGQPGEKVLISWSDAVTLFHEFGHGMHGLLSNVNYPTVAGTAVPGDFVEFPSQINERWLSTPQLLAKFALHCETGKEIPPELLAKIHASSTFNQGFETGEYLASGIYDLKIHLAATPDQDIDPNEFERTTMAEIDCPKEIVMRHRPTQFGHLFNSDGYSAGYYVYIWADTMCADAGEAFDEAGSYYDEATCKRLYNIVSAGNSGPLDEAFRAFRGRDVDTDALMRDRGFPVT